MKKLFMMLMLFAPLATFAQQKFGHINAQEVMASMPEFIKVRGEIEATAKQYENDLKAMQDELQRKAQEYDKRLTKTTHRLCRRLSKRRWLPSHSASSTLSRQ